MPKKEYLIYKIQCGQKEEFKLAFTVITQMQCRVMRRTQTAVPFGTAVYIEWMKLFRNFFRLDDFLAIVVSAILANTVAQLHLLAMRALGDTRNRELPMSATTGISAGLRNFSFRRGHNRTSFIY